MSALVIRALVAKDLPALLGLYRQLHVNDSPFPQADQLANVWQEILEDRRQYCLGGYLAEELVCTCTLLVVPNLTRGARPYALIENVVTAAAQRGQGYGHAILQHARTIAWQQGCYKIMLLTGRQDEATQHFYESAGFDRHAKQAFYATAPT